MSPSVLDVQVKSLRRQLDRLERAVSRDHGGPRKALADLRGAWAGVADATDADLHDARYSIPCKLVAE